MRDPIAVVVEPRSRDLGGFSVRRALPSEECRSVGPFVFFDHMGPAAFEAGRGIDVRPHPHINLATVTYLFEGEILHRDSLGSVQPIRPGAVNWMTAGSGIVHSERTAPDTRAAGHRLHGIQTWLGLPRSEEERAPGFRHHSAESLPELRGEGWHARLVAGTAGGERSPVGVLSPLHYLDVAFEDGARIEPPPEHAERAAYLVAGGVEVGGARHGPGRLLVFRRGGGDLALRARGAGRLVLFGGEPLDGPRHLWWNFVSSRRERIEQASRDWREGRFAAVPGDPEFIPLPEE